MRIIRLAGPGLRQRGAYQPSHEWMNESDFDWFNSFKYLHYIWMVDVNKIRSHHLISFFIVRLLLTNNSAISHKSTRARHSRRHDSFILGKNEWWSHHYKTNFRFMSRPMSGCSSRRKFDSKCCHNSIIWERRHSMRASSRFSIRRTDSQPLRSRLSPFTHSHNPFRKYICERSRMAAAAAALRFVPKKWMRFERKRITSNLFNKKQYLYSTCTEAQSIPSDLSAHFKH